MGGFCVDLSCERRIVPVAILLIRGLRKLVILRALKQQFPSFFPAQEMQRWRIGRGAHQGNRHRGCESFQKVFHSLVKVAGLLYAEARKEKRLL